MYTYTSNNYILKDYDVLNIIGVQMNDFSNSLTKLYCKYVSNNIIIYELVYLLLFSDKAIFAQYFYKIFIYSFSLKNNFQHISIF